MILLKLFACVIAFTSIGWLARRYFHSRSESSAETSLLHALSGMAILSVLYFGLAAGGWFRGRFLVATAAMLFLALWYVSRWRFPERRELPTLVASVLAGSALTLLLFRFAPPFEAIVAGDDASVYSAAAGQLAKSGSLLHRDPIVLEMTEPQRRAFFLNRYREDWTGSFVRFPGGVRLLEPETGTVQFSFYHLTPVWLAFAIKAFGQIHYQILLSLVSAGNLLLLFFLGKRIGGTPAGLSLPMLLFLFYPQQFFSRFPLSEPFAQLFFLAGLLSLLKSLDHEGGPQPADLRRTGLLWGVSFLCRVDNLFLIALVMAAGLPSLPVLANQRKRWLPLLRILGAFALCAVYYQVAAGEYVNLFSHTENLRQNVLTDLGLDLITLVGGFVHDHPVLSFLVFAATEAAILLVPFPAMNPRRSLPSYAKIILSVATAVILLLPVTGYPIEFQVFYKHFLWFFPYAPGAVYFLTAIGLAYLAIRDIRKPAVQIIVALFAAAFFTYLFRPLILPGQPWSMRRFVPILIPLFFLLGLAGWNRVLSLVPSSRTWIRALIFYGAALACGLLFYSKSRYLFDAPLYGGVFSQSDALAAKIPQGALVLIPDAIAGLHLGLPLQYRNGIDTLMLPLNYHGGRPFNESVRDYLDAAIRKRPVLVLSSRGTDLIYPMWKDYRIRQLDPSAFSLLMVPRVGRYEFPAKTIRMEFPASLFLISADGSPRVSREVLAYDDPAITFLHFHEKESGFRWTRDHSILTDFSYKPEGTNIDLLIELGPMPPGFQPDIRVFINYKTEASFVEATGPELRFGIRMDSPFEIHAVSIMSKTFRENTGAVARDLGISFSKLTFDETKD